MGLYKLRSSHQRRVAKRRRICELERQYQCKVVAIDFQGDWDFLLINDGEENA